MATEKADVVIVGAGAAGGILAAELSKAGMKVIALERGPRHTTADFNPHDELRYFQRLDLRPDPKRQPITWRPNANTRAVTVQQQNYGNQAGGGTVHYGAVSWRFHADDFRVRSQTIERYGAKAIPEDSSVADWPLSYAELEPFYDKAEYEIGVSGKAGNLQGRKIDGGNVHEAPRQREYPLPPLQVDQAGTNFEAAARKLGLHPFSTPRAIVSQPYNGRPGCSYCGFCQAFGCHIGAKSSILVTKLPEADATGNFKLITGAMCYRVNSDNSGRATGVSYYGPDRSDNTVEADLVIMAPFIYDIVRLLLLSKSD
ncbi:MAG: gluconate 2-dehydrogenase alpha chain [Alphaproteobacteria bacterium]|nr:gluconate 2-dehydrogenase alpha chain [Alphaproteobacteria bacterium]